MAKAKAKPKPEDWEVSNEIVLNGRTVGVGTELSVRGLRGRYRFIEHVSRPLKGVEWITAWGGPKHSEALRSFRPEQVKTVHRIVTTGKSLMEERKAAKRGD